MLILGITNNDVAGACLVENGKILSAIYEERFTRTKSHKVWPQKSIDFVLAANAKKLDEVDLIAYGWSAGFNEDYCLELYIDRLIEESLERPEAVKFCKKRILDELHNDREKRQEFASYIKQHNFEKKVVYIDHHDSHAWASYLCSPYHKALVVTADGRGDYRSLTIRLIIGNTETALRSETSIDSLGYFYGRITHLLGFTPNKHEGKVTGLAAHGNPLTALPLMQKMIDLKNGKVRGFCGEYYQPSYQGYSETLMKEVVAFSKEDIAAAAQFHTENILVQLVTPYVREHKVDAICLAGGVFGNVRVNQKLAEIAGVKNLFVLPCMGDDGLSLAAAVVAQYQATGERCYLETMMLGTVYAEETIALAKNQSQFTVEEPEGLVGKVVELLAKNQILAVVAGKMEFGPRSLCHRSIIYPANDKTMNTWLNERLNRTEFMPFAPVTTTELAPLCFERWTEADVSSRYMTRTYTCKPLMLEKSPAVVHVDNTARPQVIAQNDNPFMHSLIQAWYNKTGEPCLVNTSFNRHEEPIIDNLEQALSVLQEKTIQAIVFNNRYVITLKDGI